jgi:hypothetical protein
MDRVFEAIAAFKRQDQLFVLELSWMAIASHARNDMHSEPLGFWQERNRQLAVLDGIRSLVHADTPDVELERLWREHDIEGIVRYRHDSSASSDANSHRMLRISYLFASLGRLREERPF